MAAVRRELEEADRVESVEGQMALLLAARFAVATGAAAVPLSRSLSAYMARATASESPQAPTTASTSSRVRRSRPLRQGEVRRLNVLTLASMGCSTADDEDGATTGRS